MSQTMKRPQIKFEETVSIRWVRRTTALDIKGFSKISPMFCGRLKKAPTNSAVRQGLSFEPRITGIIHNTYRRARRICKANNRESRRVLRVCSKKGKAGPG